MKEVKADLHVHLKDVPDENSLYEILDSAEKSGVKVLGLLEYSNLNFFKKGLYDRVKNHISEHYTGKLVSSIEIVSSMDEGIISKYNNFNYEGFRCDVCLYDFDPALLMEYYNDEQLKKIWEQDLNMFLEKLDNFYNNMLLDKQEIDSKIFYPEKQMFINDFHTSSWAGTYLKYLNSISATERFKEIFKLQKLDIQSDITRNLITNPKSPIAFHEKLLTPLTDVFRIAKKVKAKVCLAHPAYMSHDVFDTEDYIKTTVELSRSSEEFEPITMLGSPYMLDCKEDLEIIYEQAKNYNLALIPSTDANFNYRKQLDNNKTAPYMFNKYGSGNDDKLFYTPRPGFAVRPFITQFLKENNLNLSHKDFLDIIKQYPEKQISKKFMYELENCEANLTMDIELANSFKDEREYNFSLHDSSITNIKE